jgi:hypothetical protein
MTTALHTRLPAFCWQTTKRLRHQLVRLGFFSEPNMTLCRMRVVSLPIVLVAAAVTCVGAVVAAPALSGDGRQEPLQRWGRRDVDDEHTDVRHVRGRSSSSPPPPTPAPTATPTTSTPSQSPTQSPSQSPTFVRCPGNTSPDASSCTSLFAINGGRQTACAE